MSEAKDFVLPRTVWVNVYEDGTMGIPCHSPSRAEQDAARMRARGIGLVEVLTYAFSERNAPEAQSAPQPREIDELRCAIRHENGELTIRGSGAAQVWPADFRIRLRDAAADDVIVQAKDAAESQCTELAKQVAVLTEELKTMRSTAGESFGEANIHKRAFDEEKRQRIYYQDIVYHVCNVLDQANGAHIGCQGAIVCGTVDAPTTQVQKGVERLAETVATLTRERDHTAELLETMTQGAIELAARIDELDQQLAEANKRIAHEREQRNLRHNAYLEATAKIAEQKREICQLHDIRSQLCEAVNKACIGHDQPITHEQALDGIRELQRVYEQSWEIAQQAPSCAAPTPIEPDKRSGDAPSDGDIEAAQAALADPTLPQRYETLRQKLGLAPRWVQLVIGEFTQVWNMCDRLGVSPEGIADMLNRHAPSSGPADEGWMEKVWRDGTDGTKAGLFAALRRHAPAARYPEVADFLDRALTAKGWHIAASLHAGRLQFNVQAAAIDSRRSFTDGTLAGACRKALAVFKGNASETPKSSPATAQQPAPTGNGREITPLVIADLEERSRVGAAKYGTPLRTNNGRDALTDLYQELLDAAQYCRQMLAEREPQPTT